MKKVKYQKILVAHDGSRLASVALPHAIAITRVFKAEVLLVQVIDSIMQVTARMQPPASSVGSVFSDGVTEEVYESERKTALDNLTEIKDKLEEVGITKIIVKMAEGIPGEEIVHLVKRQKIDLVVMSTHGRSGLGRVLMGSVADHVVRHASCPVLLVHSGRR